MAYPIFNFDKPEWTWLETAVKAAGLPPETCGEFMWMCEEPQGIHQYKHSLTRRYAHLGARTYLADAVDRVRAAREDR